jgi:outer membrane cobalamin receptor
MKAVYLFSIISFLFLLFTGTQFGCTSTKNNASVSKKEANYGYTNILEMLRKEPSLRITGPTSNPDIRVTGGGRSIAGSNEPLFVVDGAAVGRGYISVRNIDVNMVESINVISGARAGKYGSRGGMGVIEITTKVKN